MKPLRRDWPPSKVTLDKRVQELGLNIRKLKRLAPEPSEMAAVRASPQRTG
jgi:hypothetical protein